jgi:hypothetical protein
LLKGVSFLLDARGFELHKKVTPCVKYIGVF